MTKKQVTVNLDEELLEWIEKKIVEKKFATRSHGLEYAIMHLIREEKIGEQGNGEVPCSVPA
jgi:metal-responsive CopG/Arc/MetJ family transcriptional regulator